MPYRARRPAASFRQPTSASTPLPLSPAVASAESPEAPMPRSLNSMHTSIYPEAQMHIPIVRRWIVLAALVLAAPLGCSSDSKSPTDPGEDIEPPKATSLALSQTSLAFAALQDSSQLTATVKDQHGNTMADATISWASTDTAV